MQIYVESFFLCILATVFCCVEIESEGRYGWADKMPTWYRAGHWYNKPFGNRPITGYHVFMFTLPVLIFHAHFAMGMPWSWEAESTVWSRYFIFCVVWDYYWFILNPFYEGKFKKTEIWWHAQDHWVAGRIPMAYAAQLVAAVAIPAIQYGITQDPHELWQQGTRLGFVIGWTVLLRLARHRYHDWYYRMRMTDERDKADIFYR